MRRVFSAAPGGPITDRDAKRLGPVLSELTEKCGGRLTPKDVVDEARSPQSILHSYFEWDLEKAAERHWIQTARQIISHIKVRIVTSSGKQVPVRNWFSVRTEPDEGGKIAYVSVERIQSNKFLREQVIRDALREAQAWGERYKIYRELDSIRFEVERTVKSRQRKEARA